MATFVRARRRALIATATLGSGGLSGILPPSQGLQFFGDEQIYAATRAMTVHLRDLTGATLWSTTLAAV